VIIPGRRRQLQPQFKAEADFWNPTRLLPPDGRRTPMLASGATLEEVESVIAGATRPASQ
jgi:hypothetical protein